MKWVQKSWVHFSSKGVQHSILERVYSIPPSLSLHLATVPDCQSSCDLVSQVGNRKTEAKWLVWNQREQECLCISKRVLPFASCGVHLHQGMGQGKVRRTKVLFGTTSNNSRTAYVHTIWWLAMKFFQRMHWTYMPNRQYEADFCSASSDNLAFTNRTPIFKGIDYWRLGIQFARKTF